MLETQLIVDSASFYSLVTFLKEPETTDEWSQSTAWNVTLALTSLPNLRIAPGIGGSGAASGNYETLMNALRVFVPSPISQLDSQAMREAKAESVSWATERSVNLRDFYRKTLLSHPVFPLWLEWSVANAWLEHARRLGGLFDETYTQQIASVLECTPKELAAVHNLSNKPESLSDLIDKRTNSDGYEMMLGAYVVSALIRGYYHDYLCRKDKCQVMHHPFRSLCLSTLAEDAVLAESYQPGFYGTNAEIAWAYLLLHSARKGWSENERIEMYADNITKAKRNSDRLNLSHKESTNHLEEALYDNAKKSGLTVYSHWVEMASSLAVGLLTGLATMKLQPYAGLAAGVSASFVFTETHLSTQSVDILSRPRLKSLAKRAAGRVSTLAS